MAQDNSQMINTLMGMLGDNPAEKINAVVEFVLCSIACYSILKAVGVERV